MKQLHTDLSNGGFAPWMDTVNIYGGEVWQQRIREAIDGSDFFLACLSKISVDKKGFLQAEISQALDRWQERYQDRIYLIPVRLERCKKHDKLRRLHWVDLFEPDGLDRLRASMKKEINRRAKESSGQEASTLLIQDDAPLEEKEAAQLPVSLFSPMSEEDARLVSQAEMERARREVECWLREFWGDHNFRITEDSYAQPALRGSYTSFSCRVERSDRSYMFKRYGKVEGARTEIRSYQEYSKHQIIPRLIAKLPAGTANAYYLPEGILTPYLNEYRPVSLLETLAVVLNLATVFTYFSSDQRIYFDLKRDSLRIDATGCFHLIDFTDLISPSELYERGGGLPVPDRSQWVIPPEARKYQKAYAKFRDGNAQLESVRLAALELQPETYHTYRLGSLILEFLGGRGFNDVKVQTRIRFSGSPTQGAFTKVEQQRMTALFARMLRPQLTRIPLDGVRRQLWELLRPRLRSPETEYAPIASRARHLLYTLTHDKTDPLSDEIHRSLRGLWKKNLR